ncbi:MAG: transposase [Bacteroidia bacterium]
MSKTRKFHGNELTYFTITVVGWQEIFTRRNFQDILVDVCNFSIENKGLNIYSYVIMPNHAHFIADSQNRSLGRIIAELKSFSAQKLISEIREFEQVSRKERFFNAFRFYNKHFDREHQLWIEESHPVILEGNEMIEQKNEYIEMNPVKAGFVDEPHYWRLSSANADSPITVSEL